MGLGALGVAFKRTTTTSFPTCQGPHRGLGTHGALLPRWRRQAHPTLGGLMLFFDCFATAFARQPVQ